MWFIVSTHFVEGLHGADYVVDQIEYNKGLVHNFDRLVAMNAAFI